MDIDHKEYYNALETAMRNKDSSVESFPAAIDAIEWLIEKMYEDGFDAGYQCGYNDATNDTTSEFVTSISVKWYGEETK